MLVNIIRFIFTLVFIISLGTFAFAQQKSEPAPQKEYVENTGFKGKIFELKYRDPNEIYSTISPLASGFKGATISVNQQLKTITVRDFPENIAAIEEAIKRLDVPPAPRAARLEPDIEIHMHVLLANSDGGSEQLPAELKDVIKQLQATLAFNNYRLVTSIVQRAKVSNFRINRENAMEGSGNAEWIENKRNPDGTASSVTNTGRANYEYRIASIGIIPATTGVPTVFLENLGFSFGNSRIKSNIEVRDGEKVVVGTTGYGNNAMILVLTAKMVK